MFAGIVAKGGVVRAIRAPKAGSQPRSFFDKLNGWAQGEGKPGLGYIVLEGGAGEGPDRQVRGRRARWPSSRA